jgi:pyruvate,water dikinase
VTAAGGVAELSGRLDESRYGGKVAAQARAAAAGLPVPSGFAVDAETLAALVGGDGPARAAVLAARAALPPGPLAVRSSAVGEDGGRASFAGQFRTVLGVDSDAALLAALAEVHGSGADAAGYGRRLGLSAGPLAALVQRLVPADVAGVLFTADPAGRAGATVEASWGLGEAVVAGLVTPDSWLLDRDGAVLAAATGWKDVAVRPAAGGVRTEPVAGPDAGRPCLDGPALRELAALGARCVEVFGGEQDMEWAVAGGVLHLLQARPITVPAARPAGREG